MCLCRPEGCHEAVCEPRELGTFWKTSGNCTRCFKHCKSSMKLFIEKFLSSRGISSANLCFIIPMKMIPTSPDSTQQQTNKSPPPNFPFSSSSSPRTQLQPRGVEERGSGGGGFTTVFVLPPANQAVTQSANQPQLQTRQFSTGPP